LKYQPPVFDRPIIILASPRSGSTLLFETLSKAKKLWTIGDESHAVIEHIPEFSTVFNGFKSNELTEEHGSAENINLLKLRFQQQLRDNKGRGYTSINNYPIRFLEKTPKNSLRIRFLNKVFPDALFIHLVRDPKENISSIIDGWNSKHFITYPNLPKFHIYCRRTGRAFKEKVLIILLVINGRFAIKQYMMNYKNYRLNAVIWFIIRIFSTILPK